ncbi:hypothetical protein L873DRAFT_839043 [Choiromyces venosus 120613-1]|uniref:Uncharacterized protein n=1 Tax=Choiromyces venosus 120613-1 TaxID=1336337 RepID=A0A3N4K2V4_9PEZI|nr:hypothetical protein L873DRAFT_839043 [Choiromyces venosus 120613-1]
MGQNIRKSKLPLRGIANDTHRQYPLSFRGECVKHFTLPMGSDISISAIEKITAEVLPALRWMLKLKRFEWDTCSPPSKELMGELARSCPLLRSFRCCPRRAEKTAVMMHTYSKFERLELMNNLQSMSIRACSMESVQRFGIAIQNSPELEKLSVAGPVLVDNFLRQLLEGVLAL